MSIALDEALKDVELEQGKVYRCRVRNVLVEVRVMPVEPLDLTDDAMLDPWVSFPRPPAVWTGKMKKGVLPLPSPPIIPSDDE